ncbi:hypothetical protein [Parapedobacter koreensis]|uniref:Uncharacterized protein n=1 Tax=Parapedobacter koreensis TaxID=332977 RepID=A0A1H7NK19_9SPHI|nr:hypothetical protein [Parapedobacter koreensis]SEL23900.1 hypothetical protein SAMN05421740_10418 [Parapedobacter koreensis]
MKVFELTSGVIAAVVIALGVNYYVNNAKVEEEPVVKKEERLTTPPGVWILNSEGNYVYREELPPAGDCEETLPNPCHAEKLTESDIPEEFPAAELSNYDFDNISTENGPYL